MRLQQSGNSAETPACFTFEADSSGVQGEMSEMKTRLDWMRGVIAAIAVVGSLLGIVDRAAAADPDALWKIVHNRCAVDETKSGHPAPCTVVDFAAGYAILKDIVGKTQFLLIPTTRITGIESPAVLAPGTPNFFAEAWDNTGLVDARLGKTLPREDLSLAINAITGRTQDQLHIHIDCISADVRDALARHAASVGREWAPFPEPLAGAPYRAMRIDGTTLTADPFTLLADGVPGARAAMGTHTLVLAGETFPGGVPGFILLDNHANLAAGDLGNGEALQDHDCAVGH
jgi:CDP-diacylglycerol pyrophosphatase